MTWSAIRSLFQSVITGAPPVMPHPSRSIRMPYHASGWFDRLREADCDGATQEATTTGALSGHGRGAPRIPRIATDIRGRLRRVASVPIRDIRGQNQSGSNQALRQRQRVLCCKSVIAGGHARFVGYGAILHTLCRLFELVVLSQLARAHLLPSARIRMWSDESTVHIEWDNREELMNGVPAWTAILGSYQLLRAEFIREVRSFHHRLMEQMGERVAQVLTGAPADVTIDLWQQHQQYNVPIDRLLAGPATKTDWEQVTAAISKVERGEFS